MRALLFVLHASVSLLACTASVQRPVRTTDGATDLEQVTRSASNELDPAISPDAKAIAYEVAASPDATPHVEIMALTDVGSEKPGHVLYSSADTLALEPTWMPDGSGLIFVSKTGDSARGLVQTVGQGSATTRFLGGAGDPYLLADWPAVSPDGKTMAMAIENIDVFQSGARTGWRASKHFDRALGLTDLLGTGTTTIGSGTNPAWSPDGAHIAFARTSGGHAHLFVMNADGADAHQITFGISDDVEPSWSPDGKSIVFCAAHAEEPWTQANLFALRPDGSGLTQLTEGDRFACRPAWARDGFVYFHANVTDRFHIWRVRPLGAFADRL